MDHTKWLLFVDNELYWQAKKSSINFKTNSFLLYSFHFVKTWQEAVSSILSSLVMKNFKKSMRLPQSWGKENW